MTNTTLLALDQSTTLRPTLMPIPSVPHVPSGPITVVIAGASGFVGRALIESLSSKCACIGLTRSEPITQGSHDDPRASPPNVEWRSCDLFSLLQTEQALAGAQVGVYLVHSMQPKDRLSQGAFANLDLLLADNFARAARLAGVRHIVYLGGIIPPLESHNLSRHLSSRLEVEGALASTGVAVTVLRAALIIGKQSSSFRIVERLVRRLPAMLCPRWTANAMQPIDLETTVACLAHCITHEPCTQMACYDIGGPDVVSYLDLLKLTARSLKKSRLLIQMPFFSASFSKLWLSLITRTSLGLVGPLVESLRHTLVCSEPLVLQNALGLPGKRVLQAIADALSTLPAKRLLLEADSHIQFHTKAEKPQKAHKAQTVRSVQRLPLPPGRHALWVAHEYARWLPRYCWPFLRVQRDASDNLSFFARGVRRPLLELTFSLERSSTSRPIFYVTGGLLVAKGNAASKARLEFREVLNGQCILAALHDFSPSLPWPLYTISQALAHVWVMRAFCRYLKREHL